MRTQATYSILGINISLLEFSTLEYLQRGANPVLLPLVGFGIITFMLSWLHRSLAPKLHNKLPKIFLPLIRGGGCVGLVLTIVGLIAHSSISPPLEFWLPVSLMVGAALLAYSDYLSSRSTDESGFGVRVSALVALVVVGALWIITLHAQLIGERYALDFEASLSSQPKVALYSVDRLAIAGPGVRVDQITQEGSRFHFRYEGLRMLIRTGDKYIFAPEGWALGRDALFMVPTDDTRIDLIARL
ncbi:hypothetical protein [Saccharopolyspora sp. 5N708]|uniref:hypothetical protein n=1 Tax=Saccharopolyspora sp. 5N708 TaxID=3457424 RepID=UPI003FD19470